MIGIRGAKVAELFRMNDRNVTALAATSLSAAAGFALVATAVARRKTSRIDRALRPRLKLRKGHPVRSAADAMAPLGKWWAYLPASLGVAAQLRHQPAGAVVVVTSAVLAAATAQLFDRVLPQPPAPPGHRARTKPVFPSGHAFGTGTVSMTAGYVLAREGLMSREAAVATALGLPLISAGGKMLEEKHWGSDVLGGLLAAVSMSAACLAIYEAVRD